MSSESKQVRVDALIKAACGHGESRRRQGVPLDTIFREYEMLREATWTQLKILAPGATGFDAIFVIDGLLTIASRGSMIGFHRKEMETNHRFDAQLDELKRAVPS
jgi:hypothetical protein